MTQTSTTYLTWLLGIAVVLLVFWSGVREGLPRFVRYWYSRNIVKGPSSFVHALHTSKKQQIVRLGSNEFSVTDPELIPVIYGDKSFLKSEQYAAFDVNGEASIFSMRDPVEHQRRVKAVRNMFKGPEVARQGHIMAHTINRAIECLENASTGAEIDVLALMRGYAVETTSIFALGIRYLEQEGLSTYEVGTKFGRVLDDINHSAKFGRSVAWPVKQYEALVIKLQPLWDLLQGSTVRVKHENLALKTAYESHTKFCQDLCTTTPEHDVPYKLRLELLDLSEAALETEISDLLFAGTDSSATTLSTALWHLYNNPSILQALRDDLEYVDDEQLVSRPYLAAVLDESLRVAQPVPRRLPRVIAGTGLIYAEDKHNDDWHKILPAGATVGMSAYSLHRDPSFEDPQRFNPARWLTTDEAKLRRMRQCLIPFGRGHRACIGQELARSEIRLMLRHVVTHYDGIAQGSAPEYVDNFNASILGSRVMVRLSSRA
ncbi:putative Toxin biosynthesis cytochrome P450 monooxygenase [Taphrina deformans PYCC 5710]|uniref:Toxin biosynthesis cytochrome P450 monooxygenase n=1 Tax=Taphrina deformans (strain PYCC 5710 / ATCC 11124 / CBS 356.35 / IMI 108563 / JCM 9778 / NBRC 8474) TaxID=1097556 RepID=R4XBN4_TAPDE|nr:putative Toxin biosynthesis cytochrome P450 monooxygenase [Taphrina deformans PYCC 5710]|eukprot:CCG81786.1 putative Toxin biosynthesis cytochrome P450 monooxygenase [Taphrina deformans PYCC 5710]